MAKDAIISDMDYFSGIILGLVQGVLEFLPVSSSGHLVIVREFLSLDKTNQLAVDGILHLATTLAIVIYFWSDIWSLLQTGIRKLGRLPVNEKDLILLKALIMGTLPAAVLGFFLEDFMDQFMTAGLVGVMLFVGALFFMYVEWRYFTNPPQGNLTVKRGFFVGCFQALALIPGFSRSGSTLAGGMLLGMTRFEAAKFSFLLSIPITLGFGVKKLIDLIVVGGQIAWGPILVGALVSFFVALIVIHFFLHFIRRYTLWPFIWYSIILAIIIGYIVVYVHS